MGLSLYSTLFGSIETISHGKKNVCKYNEEKIENNVNL